MAAIKGRRNSPRKLGCLSKAEHKANKACYGDHYHLTPDYIENSPAYINLSVTARVLYHVMLKSHNGQNNGAIEMTLEIAKRHNVAKSSSTLVSDLRKLGDHGLIAKTRQGGIKSGGARLRNWYRFTHLPVFERPWLREYGVEPCEPTREFESFDPSAEKPKAGSASTIRTVEANETSSTLCVVT